MLDVEIADLEIGNPYDIKTYTDGNFKGLRQTIVDVSAKLANGIRVVIEIQVREQAWLDRRALYYVASRYVSNLDQRATVGNEDSVDSVDKYEKLSPVWGICILGHTYFTGDTDAYRCYNLYDKEHNCGYGIEGTDLMRIAFLELPKQAKSEQQNLVYWEKLFRGEDVGDSAPAYIKEAYALIELENLSAKEAEMITAEQQQKIDYDAEMHYARTKAITEGRAEGLAKGIAEGKAKGRAEGRAEGIAEGVEKGRAKGIAEGKAEGLAEGEAKRLQDARNLLALDVPVEKIHKATGISIQELEAL
jgi:predicted transposase/invertase (TIGR01784 family)